MITIRRLMFLLKIVNGITDDTTIEAKGEFPFPGKSLRRNGDLGYLSNAVGLAAG